MQSCSKKAFFHPHFAPKPVVTYSPKPKIRIGLFHREGKRREKKPVLSQYISCSPALVPIGVFSYDVYVGKENTKKEIQCMSSLESIQYGRDV